MKSGEKMQKRLLLVFFIILVALFSIFGCSRNRVYELEKEELFRLPIGTDDNAIGVKKTGSGMVMFPTQVVYKNGFFYMVDGVNSRIMKVTSRGDVIMILSKPRDGEMVEVSDENVIRTKHRNYYDFDNIGFIAVDNENNMYIENKFIRKIKKESEIELLGFEEQYEEELYFSYILKFDRLGYFQYSIGVNGVDSEPFFYVYKITTNNEGNLIVITSDEEEKHWGYYEYDGNGNLLYKKSIKTEDVFNLKDIENATYFVMDVYPSLKDRELIFWISLYDTTHDTKEIKEEESLWGEEIEIENIEEYRKKQMKESKNYVRDLLYYKLLYYDLDTARVRSTYKWEERKDQNISSTEELLGFDRYLNGYLWKYAGNNSAIITIFKPNGANITRRRFNFDGDGLWTNISVDPDGSISATKVTNKDVCFYIWRTEKLINAPSERKGIIELIKEKLRELVNANR